MVGDLELVDVQCERLMLGTEKEESTNETSPLDFVSTMSCTSSTLSTNIKKCEKQYNISASMSPE